MKHWHIKHRTKGEAFVCTEDDQTPFDVGYTGAWTLTELEREPGEFDRFTAGALVEDAEARVKTEKRAAMAALGTDGLIDIIEDLKARVEVIEADGGNGAAARKAQ